MKKTAWLCLTLLLCLCAVSAQALTVTGLETESVPRKWETNAFFPRMEALTGIHVDARGVDDGEAYQALLSDMLEGEMPADVLFKAALTREMETRLLDAGAIIDLAPLIEENMPNLSALLDAHPDWREIIALPDGRIASLPQLTLSPRQAAVWINRAWLEALNLPAPGTVRELTDALQAMLGADLNGNGKKDEIPADLIGVYEMRWLLPYFGIVADDYNLARDESGALVFAPELPAYRAFVETLRAWYVAGILPQSAFTGTHAASLLASSDENAAVTSGLIVTTAPYTHVPDGATLDFEPLLLAGPDGRVRWRDLLGGVWTGAFAVTSACEDPAQALEWVDALYGEDGGVLAYAGVQDEDYAVDAQGRWSFPTDGARTVADIRENAIIYTGETTPGLVPDGFLARMNSAQDVHVLAGSAKVQAVAERVTRPYALLPDAQVRADELASAIGGEVDRGIARFVTGETDLTDENWDAWLASLKAAGSEALLALFREAEQ